MRIFVTGAAGFIGSNFARLALNEGYDVTVYDALTYAGNLSTISDIEKNPKLTFVKGDICDNEAVAAAMRGHDVVINFAAESHVDRSIVGPDEFVRTNCLGTNSIMSAARDLQIGKVVQISTDEVYGHILSGSFVETDRLDPRSPYSASKASSDLIALSYFSTYDVPVVITRSSNNYGPYQYPEKLIPLFVSNLIDGQKVPLYGDGLNVRDWCYVDDNCTAIDLVMREGEIGTLYNIGGGNEKTNRDIAERILSLMGVDDSFIEPVADRLGHDRRYSIDCSRLFALGWKPAIDFDQGLAQTVDWYRANEEWWRPLKSR